jgi:thiamine kinase-like enzyme
MWPGRQRPARRDDWRSLLRQDEALDHVGNVLNEADVDRLRAAAERLSPFLQAPSEHIQPLHGDAHAGNLIATRAGLVWIDFEETCRGPVEWDLATMMDADAVALHHKPDPDVLARCTELRALQVALCLIAFYDEFGDLDGWDEGIQGMLQTLASAS